MIKDFVPAKANLSTGLVINTNILERNKIARHEPVMTFVDYSGSIDTAFITGSNGLDEVYTTAYTSSTTYISGSILKSNTQNKELFTGELGGTVITVHSQSSDNIVYELNNLDVNVSSSIYDNYYRLPINPTLNNVLTARTSPQYLDVDYGYSTILPVNINFLTASLNTNLNAGGYGFLNAPVQDSNYTLKRHIYPRYNGSRLFGNLYNVYSPTDISYGNSPVIDLTPVKFAYFKEITSQSLTFPGRVNVNTKYLIDSASNVIELTEANKNIFDLQSIFNKTFVNVALDNINQPSKQKKLNGLKPIYAGGFRYEPILQNVSNLVSSHSSIDFTFLDDIPTLNPASGSIITGSFGQGGMSIGTPYLTNTPTTFPNTANTPSDNLVVAINSGITFPVTRTTPSDVEIRRRVTGSVKLTVKLSPPDTGAPVELWTGASLTGTKVEITAPGSIDLSNAPYGEGTYSVFDNVISVKVPAGKKLSVINTGTGYAALDFIGPITASGLDANIGYYDLLFIGSPPRPLVRGTYGTDVAYVYLLDCSASFTTGAIQNTFKSSSPLFSLNTGSGNYALEGPEGLVIEATYPFEGEIILRREEQVADIELRNLSGSIGFINHSLLFTKFPNTSAGVKIQFDSLPTSSITPLFIGDNWYYTQAPATIYITGSSDTGYDPGEASINNWYFERGNKVVSGSVFTLLTASYALSKLYYDHYIPSASYYGNFIKQVLPTQSLDLGYQDISEYFNPKKGDLIRFYNHDSERFPYSPVFEREIINIYPPSQPALIGSGVNGTGSYAGRLVFEVSELEDSFIDTPSDIPPQACINNPTGSIVGRILNFIMLSKIPDETNIVLFTEKNLGQTSPGILLPEYLNKEMKDDAANIVKRLKAQNLLDVSTTNITDVQGGGF
jgi:hypothetical protein